jgi:hypothetical protein
MSSPRVRPAVSNIRKAQRATVDRRAPRVGPRGRIGPSAYRGSDRAPIIRIQPPDVGGAVRGIARGFGNAFANNPVDRIYRDMSNTFNRVTGGR